MVQYNVQHTLLCLQIGNILVIFLSGLVFSKIYNYFTSKKFKDSSIWEKCLIFYMCFLQALHTALVVYTLFGAVLDWHKLDSLEDSTVIPYGIGLSMFVGSCLKTTVQALVIKRAKRLSGWKCIPILCWVVISLGLAGSLGCSISAVGNTFGGYSVVWLKVVAAVLVTSIAVDFTTAAVQWIYLHGRSKESKDYTKRLLGRIIMVITKTTLITSVPTLLTVVLLLFAMHRSTLAWITTLQFLPEIFTVTFFASLLSPRDADGNTVTYIQHPKGSCLPSPVSAVHSLNSKASAGTLRGEHRESILRGVRIDITKEEFHDSVQSPPLCLRKSVTIDSYFEPRLKPKVGTWDYGTCYLG